MDQGEVARETLRGLEGRLARLQFVFQGDSEDIPPETTTSLPVVGRLQKVDAALSAFEAQSSALRELLQRHKEHITRAEQYRHISDDDHVDIPLVLSYSKQFRALASQLRAVQDVPLTDASTLVNVVAQTSRLERARGRAVAQQQQIARLRTESAALVNRWHEIGVLSVGEAWSEWEERLLAAERTIRQNEARRRRELEAV